jgi:hypothetical protein
MFVTDFICCKACLQGAIHVDLAGSGSTLIWISKYSKQITVQGNHNRGKPVKHKKGDEPEG